MTQEPKNGDLNNKLLSEEQVERVTGGANNRFNIWEKKAIDSGEQRGICLVNYKCRMCGTVDSTFASTKSQGGYQDCKCYDCGRQVSEISAFYAFTDNENTFMR